MKKFLILSAMIAGMGITANSATINFSYANDDNVDIYGKSAKQIYDVAMMINNPALKGSKINKIQAYITSPECSDSCAVWMTKELTLDKKVNVPDIMAVNVTPVEGNFGGYPAGLLELTLSEPYEYNGEPLYIGYSLRVSNLQNDAEKYPILVSEGVNENGFFLHTEKTNLKWASQSANLNCVAVINVEIEGNFPENSLVISSVPDIIAATNESYNILANVINTGTSTVNSVGYTYSVDGETFNGTYDLPVALVNNPAITTTIEVPCEGLSETGKYVIDLKITEVNGSANEAEMAQTTTNLYLLPQRLVSRPLVEEYTGLGCGWCPRGYTGMEEISKLYGDDVVIMCYHNTFFGPDAMSISNNNPVGATSAPTATINRGSIIDPYFGTSDEFFGINYDVKAAMEQQALCDIEVIDFTVDGDQMTVSTNSIFATDLSGVNYRVGYVLTANNLSDPKWAQSNYFSGSSQYKGTPLEWWYAQDSYVYGLIFNDVVVNMKGMSGNQNTALPSEITFGEYYPMEFTLQCANIKNSVGNELPFDLNEAVINVFIIDADNNKILNANKKRIGGESGIAINKAENASVVETVYYDMAGRKISNPSNGIYVKVEKMNDGTTRNSKTIIR